LRRGRWLTDQDRQGAPLVVIVSESFGRQFLPNEEPLGKRLQGGMGKGDWKTIVGVVGDIKNAGLEKKPMPEMFESYLQAGTAHMSLAVRTADNPMKLAEAVRRRVMSVDPDQPIYDMMTMEQRFANVLAPRRIAMTLLGVFSGLALVLTAVGIYGVIAYAVAQRTHEIGIRMALGGQRADILQLILKHGLGMAFLGIVAGLAGGMALTRLLSSHLFGVTATDPLTFAGVGLLLSMVALAACLLPAWRATQVDPMEALRHE
jgi:putative ABC transport system permease protein